ncbi:hypothetical protein OIV83_003752 [Microbotryomycetes sp. JL201]|nr:hypothetical protein OIV83_003752 [Microbotryomycetes sp. JL201]
MAEHGPLRSYAYTTTEALDGPKRVTLSDFARRPVWHKNRKLTGTEMVDYVVDSSGQTRWTVHRPVHGWYLALRNPRSPPETFIALEPSRHDPPSTLSFAVESRVAVHSATPPPGSRDSACIDIGEQLTDKETAITTHFETRICHFRLEPAAGAGQPARSRWSIASVASWISGSNTSSWTCVWTDQDNAQVARFHEHASLLSTSTRGTLALAVDLIDRIGLEPSFWAAVAFAYTEFLEDKQAYEASVSDD